jgi:large subunit ribosomal protein L28
MAKCDLCDKSIQTGSKISIARSHVSRRAKRVWRPNVQKVRVVVNGAVKTVNMCAKCLRSQKFVRAV